MIVIPMAGRSSRFFDAGFTQPKYELPLGGQTLFDITVKSFENYFESQKFIFPCRSDFGAEEFVAQRCEMLNITSYEIVPIEGTTRGQADTVIIALDRVSHDDGEPLIIFNIDTIRPGFELPSPDSCGDGYLEVFRGPGENWSFVEPLAIGSSKVGRTTEKERISDLCSTGLYYFRRCDMLRKAFAIAQHAFEKGELQEIYVAPLYNNLIKSGHDIRFVEIPREDVQFSGTPEEYRIAILGARS